MTHDEIEAICSRHNAAVIAPAGHGKTEMITELVSALPGIKLVLTHTNAGVSVLIDRMTRNHISMQNCCITTISAFCMKWCNAYPHTAEIDLGMDLSDKHFFPSRHNGAAMIFSRAWARDVLQKTYACVIVDEYQDCLSEQHQVFLEINKTIPVYVLGDPMQSIFGWNGKLVSWDALEFEIIPIKTYPWRWDKANKQLGQYLLNIRNLLLPALNGVKVSLPVVSHGSFVKKVCVKDSREAWFLNNLVRYQSALYLTKWPKAQCAFSRRTGGLFQNDEPLSLEYLFDVCKKLDVQNGIERAKTLFTFISECATHVSTELSSYQKHINNGDCDFSRITKHIEFGKRIQAFCQSNCLDDMLCILDWIYHCPVFKLCRIELFLELCRAIRFARDKGTTIHEAAQTIRIVPEHQRRYPNFKRLSSRAVLSKGLEFDCVVIDLSPNNTYTATEMYVAMTRAMRMIYFITDDDSVLLNVPEGI